MLTVSGTDKIWNNAGKVTVLLFSVHIKERLKGVRKVLIRLFFFSFLAISISPALGLVLMVWE